MDLSKLTLEIFSMLEQKWLSDLTWSPTPPYTTTTTTTKTHVLCIDGGFGPDGLVAAHALVHLEHLLQSHTNNPSARITDFFHLLAGTGLGGVLATLLTASDSSSKPLFSAAEACDFLMSNLRDLFRPVRGLFRHGKRRRFSGRSFEGVLRRALRGMTLKNTCKPLLVPCYDLASSAPFVFSRADAADSPCFDFELWAVCRATAATPGLFKPFTLTSVDGKTSCAAVDGGLVMNNPAAAAVTHVLHNKRDFPAVNGVEDLLVLSLGNDQHQQQPCPRPSRSNGGDCSSASVMEIVLRGVSETVDQILASAFRWNHGDYVRIQANGLAAETEEKSGGENVTAEEGLRREGERMMKEKGLEALPFGGKRLLTETNGERMEGFVRRLAAPPQKPLLLLPAPSPLGDDAAISQLPAR